MFFFQPYNFVVLFVQLNWGQEIGNFFSQIAYYSETDWMREWAGLARVAIRNLKGL